MAEPAIGAPIALDEHWYYCVRCSRAWSTATWRGLDWACPSSAGQSWPEYHPHIGWSYVSDALGVEQPTEGASYVLGLPGIINARQSADRSTH